MGDVEAGVQSMAEAALGTPRAQLVQYEELRDTSEDYLTPRVGTPIRMLNDSLLGGMYGVFVVGGTAGVGKSAFALLTAVDAAHRGMQVIYLAGEMSKTQIMARSKWLCSKRFYDWEGVHENLHVVIVPGSYPVQHILAWPQSIAPGCERMLIVWDSFNAITEAVAASEQIGYFRAADILRSLIVSSRMGSEGAIASLVISELNQDGSTKGRNWEYKSDGIVYFKQEYEYDDGRFSVKLVKSRERSTGRYDLGSYFVLAGDVLFPLAEIGGAA
ncbi:MAG: hypothetical protein ACE5FA_05150 [Dehalococcoidia bacterium]